MSFWNSIKPTTRTPSATHVDLSADRLILDLTWSDGLRTTTSARTFRQFCPCAQCVEEWTGRRILDVDAVPEGTTILSVTPVGNYALGFTFSDQHDTGIFDWAWLRKIATGQSVDERRSE